ncbi:MAG: hypothetical protein K2O30_08495 [Duncaniella sp.]|nr:hypothetical protein [Duncaniella sp.]
MDFKRFSLSTILSLIAICVLPSVASCQSKREGKVGGPQLGTPGGGPVIDKTGDSILQAMIKAELPLFKQFEYTDAQTGKTLKYNLYTPQTDSVNDKYPLVLFMADASTPGDSYTTPLTQGYGGLVWATDEWQKEHPCYVLVPQYSGVAVNDAYEHTDEVDMVIRLLNKIVKDNENIDCNRLYTTGQSMGGMISMYYNITYPEIFAASIFVDCHWDTSKFDELARHKFTYVTAGKSGKSFGDIQALEDAAEKDGIKYEYAEWSAKLPQAEQDSLASALLAKGAPVNIINFSPKSVLPDDGKGSEHMYSFDYAYKLTPVREWLFRQSK